MPRVGVEADGRIEFGLLAERVEHGHHLFVLHALHRRHRRAEFEHFARAEEAHHFGRFGLADGEHQDGSLLDAVIIHLRLPMP